MAKLRDNEIPIFFATNDTYAPFLTVCIKSLLTNASKDYFYKLYVLTTNLDPVLQGRIKQSLTPNSTIEFISLKDELDKIQDLFHLRDYYSKETYYRFFIPDLFPDYDKVIYLDCDTIVLGDISELYNYDIKDYFIAGALEEVMQTVDTFGNYVEEFLGVPRKQYINAGVLLINNKRFLKFKIAEKFVELAKQYTFRVTQDEDYLNVLCKNRIKILNLGWNKTAYKNDAFDDKDLKLIHYKINWKPWHYKNTLYEEYFWDFAKQTDFYDEILAMRDAYGDDLKQRDANAYVNLVKMAEEDIANPKGYWKTVAQFEQQKAKGLVRINYLKLLRKLIGIRSRTTSEQDFDFYF